MAPKSANPKSAASAKGAAKKRASSPAVVGPVLPKEDIKRFKSFVQAEAKRGAKKNDQTDAIAEAYEASDRNGKREILEKWSGDRSLGWVAGYLQEKAFVHSEGSETRSSWHTEAAICAREGLGQLENLSEDNRKVLDELLKNYEQRPHELHTLAALGIKQYRTKKIEEVEASFEQDAVRLSLTASGVDKPEKASGGGRKGKSPAPPEGSPAGNGGDVVVNYNVLNEKTTKEVKKLLTLLRKAVATAGKTPVENKEFKDPVRQGLRVVQDAADSAEDALESVSPDEAGYQGLKRLLETLQANYTVFLSLLEKCCPKALPKAKAKAKAEAKAEEDAAEGASPAGGVAPAADTDATDK